MASDPRAFGPYNFGLYHWRRRGRATLLGGLCALWGGYLAVESGSRARRIGGGAAALWGLATAGRAVGELARTPPWRVDTGKYEALADRLPRERPDRVLDVGCGTGRSLVGLAPAFPEDTAVVGIDVFDDRIVLGNAPERARRNAARAGLSVAVARGDGACLPIAGGSMEVVTACRVLHDLPAAAARDALAEAHRVCRPGGALGVLELPVAHDAGADPATYWRDLVSGAGFDVERVEAVERDGREYVVVVGVA